MTANKTDLTDKKVMTANTDVTGVADVTDVAEWTYVPKVWLKRELGQL